MDKKKTNNITSEITSKINGKINISDRIDILVQLAVELELTHLLIPDALPVSQAQIDLPDLPPELYQKRKDRSEKPCDFIRRVYEKWHGNRLARHHLLHLDKPLYHALCCWLIKNDPPEWFDLPTKKELNDRELAYLGLEDGDEVHYPSYDKDLKDKLRLYNAARNRK